MAQRGVAVAVSTEAWKAGARHTGDAANITAYLCNDSTLLSVAATNAVGEILLPGPVASGRYLVTLTANERLVNHQRVMFVSVTSGVVLPDVEVISNELRGARAVTITVLTPGGVPVAGMSVAIYNSGQTDVVALCVTDASGIARLQGTTSLPYLDDGSCKIVCSLAFYSVTNPTSLTVDGAETVAITATPTDPTLADASYQAITGTARRINGDSYVNGKVVVRTDTKEQVVDGVAVSGMECKVTIGADDTFIIVAQIGAAIIAKIYDDGTVVAEKQFTVTDNPTATWESY
jgi:hypothetical protein